jgi:hypothetical protein
MITLPARISCASFMVSSGESGMEAALAWVQPCTWPEHSA